MTETKIINRKEVFKGRAFNVEELQLTLPDGREQLNRIMMIVGQNLNI